MWPFGRHRPLGSQGETIARRFLSKRGLKVLARNYRCPAGEIDLIMLEEAGGRQGGKGTIAFVEVKTRRDDHYTDPEAAVDRDKQRRIKKTAGYYLAHHDSDGYDVRYDIVSVVASPGQQPEVRYISDAFR